MGEKRKVGKLTELILNKSKSVIIDGKQILLIKLDDGVFAVDGVCTHEEESLAEGYIDDGTIECPRHGAIFDIRSGVAKTLPAVEALQTYSIFIENDDIYLTGL